MRGNHVFPGDDASARLLGQVCRIEQVNDIERQQMFRLMQESYENVDRDEFDSDFDQKQWVILARESHSGVIRGFSTQVTYFQDVDGHRIRILFSGDTIVARQYWASNPLAQLWGRLALSLIDESPDSPFYWFLICKGYRTYRFLPVFFDEYFPRCDINTPGSIKHLISAVASTRFGSRYRKTSGIINALPGGCRLRASIADVTADRLKNRHVAFFDRTNPGHVDGDELCCIASLTRKNLNRRAYRVIGEPINLPIDITRTATAGQ
jgi:hypothetical protein